MGIKGLKVVPGPIPCDLIKKIINIPIYFQQDSMQGCYIAVNAWGLKSLNF